MCLTPPKGRNQLTWSIFKDKGAGSHVLNLHQYYAGLFEMQKSDLMKKSNTDWRDSRTDNIKYAFFVGLDNDEIKEINEFISFYEQHIILGLNKNIEPYFTNELDFCIACDFTWLKHAKGEKKVHTEIGEMVYRAKYKNSRSDLEKLGNAISSSLLYTSSLIKGGDVTLSYIPSGPNKVFDIPQELTKFVNRNVAGNLILRRDNPIVDSALKNEKSPQKDLEFKDKVAMWNNIIDTGGITISSPVMGSIVYVIDDLYQSGFTMWTYAKYLKMMGAHSVIGVVCEKAWSDKDNK